MKKIKTMIPALIALGLAFVVTGCVVHGTTRVHGHARVTAPELVTVSPGVQVVYDYHEPVFYSDGFYWRYHSGVWYRSSYHSHGWIRYNRVPRTIARIERPHTYVRYRGNARGHGRIHSTPARRHAPGPEVRDHRRAPVRARHVPAASGRGSATIRSDHRGSSKPPKARTRDNRKKNKVEVRDHRR